MITLYALIYTGTVLAVAYPILYATTRWWTTLPGRGLMIFSSIIGLVLLVTSLTILGVRLPHWIGVAIWCVIDAGLLIQITVLALIKSGGYRPTGRVKPTEEDSSVTGSGN